MPLTLHDLMSAPAPPKADEYLIYPWLQAGRLLLMVGPTEGGKTTLTLDMLAACFNGEPLWGRYPVQKLHRVLYLHAEHSLATVQEIAQKRGDIPHGCVFVVHEFGALGTALVNGQTPNIPLLREITAVCNDLKPELIIAEPISAFLATSENDNKEARQLIQVLNMLAAKYSAAILTHHHVGKAFFDPERIRPKGMAIGEARGAMAFEDAAERVLYLRPDKDSIKIETPKPKGYPLAPVRVARDVDTLKYHAVLPPEAQADVIGVFGFHLAHPDLNSAQVTEALHRTWGCSLPMAKAIVARTVAVGLLAAEDDGPVPSESSE